MPNFKWSKIFLIGGFCVFTSCNNILRDFTDKTTDQYKIDSARKYIDEEKFDEAIEVIVPVWNKNVGNEEIGYVTAVAYAGRAGLRILNLISVLIADLDTKGVFRIFGEYFSGANDDDLADIDTAIGILQTISTNPAARSNNTNFFALFVFYSRIGIIMAKNALQGTSLRANFRACHTTVDFSGATTGITNTEINKVFSSLGYIVELVSYVTTGADFDDLTDIEEIPDDISTSPVCVTSPSNVTCLAVRTLINQGKDDDGIGLGVLPGLAVNHPAGFICASVTP